ncbi:MAG: DUF952 domain-containing protein [Pseudomonadota bacterium]
MDADAKERPTGQLVYKITTVQAWDAASHAGRYDGNADDARDGFIHLSTGEQVAGTLAKHYAGAGDLLLIAYAATDLNALRWEPSRGGALFPHQYGTLDPAQARHVLTLAADGQGGHTLPDEVQR